MLLSKICSRCGNDLPLSEFNLKCKASGKRTAACKKCLGAYAKLHYKANKEVYVAKAAVHSEAARERNKALVAARPPLQRLPCD